MPTFILGVVVCSSRGQPVEGGSAKIMREMIKGAFLAEHSFSRAMGVSDACEANFTALVIELTVLALCLVDTNVNEFVNVLINVPWIT